jgi:hypothetical protein
LSPHHQSRANVQTIYVRNLSTYVSDREVKKDLPAFQKALSEDFAPALEH